MADWKIEGLKSAADTAKQILTLSTAVITLTVTLFDKLVPAPVGNAPRLIPGALVAAWVLLGLSLLAALWTLIAITGTLDSIDDFTNGRSPLMPSGRAANARNIAIPASVMMVLFLLGIALTISTALSIR
jgi:hypothetical protein